MLGCSPLAPPALEPLLQNPGGLLHGFNAEQSKVADAALFAWFDKYLKAGK
jgi:hypothetical protein